jgi:enterochelin esterase family protein
VWSLTLDMPSDWRASYALAVMPAVTADEPPPAALTAQRQRSLAAAAPGDRRAFERWFDALRFARPDPYAREQLDDELSVVSLPDAPAQPRFGAAAVPTTTWHQPAGHGCDGRDITVHVPGRATPDGWPVVVLLDGREWLDLPLPPVIEDEIAAGRLPAFLSVMIPSLDVATRVADLTCNRGFVSYVLDDVLDEVARRWPITRDPRRVVIAGKSLGGLTALYAASTRPDRVANAVIQSGSFWWPNDQAGAEWLTDQLRTTPPPAGAVYLEVGTFEWVLLEPTRRLRDVLEQRHVELTYSEFAGGHDRACWRGSLLVGLHTVTASWSPAASTSRVEHDAADEPGDGER